MSFDINQDFMATFRPTGSSATAGTVPFIDGILSTLGLSGILNVSVSTTAPTANQNKTIWLQPQENSWSGNGVVYLWDKVAGSYAAATSSLFIDYIEAWLGAALILYGSGVPSGALGYDFYWYVRTDEPGGLYHKVSGAWVLMPGSGRFAASSPNGVTGGTATASTLTHSPVWTAINDGAMFPFTFLYASGASQTLTVDGVGAHPFRSPYGNALRGSEYAAGETVLVSWDAVNSVYRIFDPGAATASVPGVVKAGLGLAVTSDGLLSVSGAILGAPGVSGGTSTAATLVNTPPITSMPDGKLFWFTFPTPSGSGETLQVDSLSPYHFVDPTGTLLSSAEYASGEGVLVKWDATSSVYRIVGRGASTSSSTTVTSWTTAGRPASPAAGIIGFNRSTGREEYWNGAQWVNTGFSDVVLPGNSSGYLRNDGSGNLSWSTPSSGSASTDYLGVGSYATGYTLGTGIVAGNGGTNVAGSNIFRADQQNNSNTFGAGTWKFMGLSGGYGTTDVIGLWARTA